MKKLLNILAITSLTTSSTITTIACNTDHWNLNPLEIGTNIKKQDNAVKYDENKTSKSGYSNYFILGDSLSDVDGATSLINNSFKDINISLTNQIKLINNIKINKIKAKILPGLKWDDKLIQDPNGVIGYGFRESKDSNYKLSFSNGPSAGYLLDDMLGTNNTGINNQKQEILPANKNIVPTVQTRNYSVGGATAYKPIDGLSAKLWSNVTIDKQAENLIAQHHVETTKNDLVFLEIGGNDLFALVEKHQDDRQAQIKLINEAMEKIKIALFTLLNNGIEKIVVGTPPDVSVIPSYQEFVDPSSPSYDEQKADYIKNISKEFNQRMLKEIEYANQYYPNQILIYDIYKEFLNLQIKHEQWYRNESGNKTAITNKVEGYTTSQEVEIKDLQLRVNINLLAANLGYLQLNVNNYILGMDKENQPGEIKFSYKLPQIPKPNNLTDFKKSIKKIDQKLDLINIEVYLTNTTDKPAKQGTDADIRIKTYRPSELVNKDEPIDSYFFTDFVHPTRGVHILVANDIYNLLGLTK